MSWEALTLNSNNNKTKDWASCPADDNLQSIEDSFRLLLLWGLPVFDADRGKCVGGFPI